MGVALAVVMATLVVPSLTGAAGAASAKVTICHRTHSTTNPYRKITVSQNAITRSQGHGDHGAADGNPAVYDSTFSYASNNKSWGDVIPGGDVQGLPFNGANNIDLNWTVAGKAVFFSTACAGMTAKAFYDTEIAAGVPEADVLADLNAQAANEDAALLAALGGSFSAGNVGQWSTAVSVTTNATTSVGTTTATVSGTLTVGATSTVPGFDYGTSPTLATFASVAGTPGTVTGSGQAATAGLTGLVSGQTYYFRATGTTNAGSDTEGVLTGSILSFTTTGAAAQTVTFDQPAGMVAGGADQALTVTTAAPSGLAVTFASTTTGVCTVAGAAVTAVAPGTCSITATQGGNATYAPATPVTRTFAVTAVARTLAIDAASFDAEGYERSATGPTIVAAASAGTGTITYSSTTPEVCSVDAGTGAVTFVDDGDCTIGAAIAAAGVHAAATAAPVTFPVTAPPVTTTTTAPPVTTTTTTAPPVTTTTTTTTATPPVDGDVAPVVPPTTSTTTVPTTTTTTPPAPIGTTEPAAPQGSVRGVAWFDRNGNGARDAREWILPGVAVTLSRVGAAATAGEATFSASAATTTVVTRSDGTYVFSGLAPGGYQVAASAAIDGFDYTSDSDGVADWIVGVGVAADGSGVADFAGLGRGALVGKMFELRTEKGLAFASVTCRWGGFDDVLGTGDDVPFAVTAAADGTFDLRGVPYGNFTCAGIDESGRRSASVAATVLSPVPVDAALPVDTPPGGGLPITGSAPFAWLVVAVLCLVAGVALLRTGRRER